MKFIDKITEILNKNINNNNILLLFLIFLFLFVIPFLPNKIYEVFFEILLLCIYIVASLSLGKLFKKILLSMILLILIEITALILNFHYLLLATRVASFAFLIFITVLMIINIAKSKKVSLLLLLEAINGYLLLGIAFTIIVVFIELISPGAFNIITGSYTKAEFPDVSYYTFTTMTTLGYGDLLPVARFAKSTSIFITLSGQIYLTIMIGMLIGKIANEKGEKKAGDKN